MPMNPSRSEEFPGLKINAEYWLNKSRYSSRTRLMSSIVGRLVDSSIPNHHENGIFSFITRQPRAPDIAGLMDIAEQEINQTPCWQEFFGDFI